MYDTVKLSLITSECEKIPNLLTDSQTRIKPTGEYSHHGNLENMKVHVYPRCLRVEGSLSKYLNGNNLERFSRKQTEEAIEKLSDSLKLPFKNAKVNRVDLAENFILKRPVSEYMSLMGQAPYFTKRPYSNNGLYYTNCRRTIIFYNKVREYQDKKQANLIPEVYKNRNVLRYELRFTKRLKQQFQSEVKAADLYNEDFYINIINRWLSTYFDIKKIKTFKDEDFKMKAVKDLKEYVLTLSLMDEIRCNLVMNRLKQAKETGEMTDRTYYRCKSEFNRLMANKKYFEPKDCILELDRKIKQAVKYYR